MYLILIVSMEIFFGFFSITFVSDVNILYLSDTFFIWQFNTIIQLCTFQPCSICVKYLITGKKKTYINSYLQKENI